MDLVDRIRQIEQELHVSLYKLGMMHAEYGLTPKHEAESYMAGYADAKKACDIGRNV